MKNRKQTDFYEIIGIKKSGEIVMLDYIFEDTLHGNPFCGATGTIFSPVDQDYIDGRNDIEFVKESYDYLWKEAVADGNTEESLEEYCESLIMFCDGCFLGHDDSYVYKISDEFKEQYYPEAVTFECIGVGRCFNTNENTEDYEVLLRPDLLELIIKTEMKNKPKLEVAR